MGEMGAGSWSDQEGPSAKVQGMWLGWRGKFGATGGMESAR